MGWAVAAGVGLGLLSQWAQSEGQKDANETNIQLANQTNAQNLAIAREQMAFQERMAASSHQRQVMDLKAAGLNPILSANAGAPTPPGASSTSVAPKVDNVMEGTAATARELTNQMLQMQRQKEEIKLMQAQTAKTDTERQVIRRGIPEAEIKNDIWNAVKKKWSEANEVNAARKRVNPLADKKAREMQKRFEMKKP